MSDKAKKIRSAPGNEWQKRKRKKSNVWQKKAKKKGKIYWVQHECSHAIMQYCDFNLKVSFVLSVFSNMGNPGQTVAV